MPELKMPGKKTEGDGYEIIYEIFKECNKVYGGGILCTVIYPAALTLAGQALFPKQANGSMIMAVIDGEERAVGSKYVGQQFEDPRFFHGRISSVNYNCYTGGKGGRQLWRCRIRFI
ncbi:MAG: potassium-transporting ATPase subunit C [Eisenbergiella sp.]